MADGVADGAHFYLCGLFLNMAMCTKPRMTAIKGIKTCNLHVPINFN